ncbi:sensor histidine kinase [Tenacibaculum sp. 190524A02b]|uniref:sensor histidine kinase n=1 Tax=Tenacibaculum vairaonense TaxID=3137860 RepID=UPI0031FA9560
MILSFLKKIGRLEAFEINSSSLVLSLMSPGLYLYSILIFEFNSNAVEIPFLREVFTFFFMVVGLLPLTKRKFIDNYYGVIVFFSLFLFQHYLIYTTALNKFSLDYLLGTFIVMFGAILMMNNRLLVVLFSACQMIHIGYWVLTSNLDLVIEGAILVSTSTIFVFSFIILNGSIRYRKNLLEVNLTLEDRINKRTEDLEIRAKELYERNKDLEEFAYVVSHDLKRPLRNIYTLADWLSEVQIDKGVNIDKEDFYENLTKMKLQVEQMDLLINGILNYSLQMEKEKEMKSVDVDALVRKIAKVNSNNKCEINLKSKLPVLLFNESQLLQVFQNLIQNAIKHNDKEKTVIMIGCEEEGKEYLFYIKDNGPGIEEKYHDKIFQLFQKLDIKTHIESIGIGLALVKKIIERNGGGVWIDSKLGEGATFFFTIKKR